MSLVVLDMEWNQAMNAKSPVFNKLPIRLRGEIIQIGAVKLTDDGQPGEEFKIDVKPVFFRKLHYKVEKLTGIDKRRLENGAGFKEALGQFRSWCGDGCTLITWGSDDRFIMEQNIIVHDLDWDWIDRWVNLQLIYNQQTQAGANQPGLATAMEFFGIEQTRVAHDALGDAYNTALVCSRLDLDEGLRQYDELSSRLFSDRTEGEGRGGPPPLEHTTIPGFMTRQEMFRDERIAKAPCPECGREMNQGRWINQGNRRYMSMFSCPEHGAFLVRIRLRPTPEDTFNVNHIVYKATEEMEEYYASKLRADGRCRRHRRKKKPAASGGKS